ncbi:Kunitz/Bovine pancreatic trypsin inhibitor domain protein [Ancylostoma duodenale]|uniref:Kunitz/Bovine pancreatic trypsin inhibitor domain protein n=1 Tax=Ancylostoma duodenale TaxID=51022 RepID=A0A0C2GIB1_9BILA|nr:Kunitz/Bovine pancreatic trypsin inhibitor domain protein [Ancylostoma duodenale]
MSSVQANQDVCKEPIDWSIFAFDVRQGKCVDFNYGGCAGNGNNFESLDECQKKCESMVS